MIISPLVNLASGYIQSLFASPTSGSSSNSPATAGTSSNAQGTNGLSPFAQVLNSLQQLQQSSPIQYQTVTHQIAGNLQTAAQSATASGNTVLANQLTQLSTDFNSASTTSQLPSVQDLAQAIGAGGYHHHHHSAGSSSTPTASNASNGSAGNLTAFLQSLNTPQAGSSGNNSLSALSIIDNTLSSAGL
jgi:hypothetical protein